MTDDMAIERFRQRERHRDGLLRHGAARHRKPLEDALGIPMVDPTQAAVTMGSARCRLGGERSRSRENSALILRACARGSAGRRLEGWPGARCRPSPFETFAAAPGSTRP
jgi:hypothetical protein